MRRIVIIATVLLFLAGLAVACYPPAGPTKPDVVDLRRDPTDYASTTRGLGSGGGCPVLDDSRGWAGGPWNTSHQFPRLYHLFAINIRGSFTESRLDDISLYDVVELMPDSPFYGEGGGLYNMTNPSENIHAYLRTANSGIKILAYTPAYFWWDNTEGRFGSEYHPIKVAVENALDDANGAGGEWWLVNTDNETIDYFDGHAVNLTSLETDLDGSDNYADWLAAYITGSTFLGKTYSGTDYWDGIRWDVSDSGPHQYSAFRIGDADENGTADLYQYGKPAINDYVNAGLNVVNSAITGAGFVVVGNGAWATGNEGYDAPSPYVGTMTGAMDEDWPTYASYDPYSGGIYANTAGSHFGGLSNTPANQWSFHMRQYVNWMDYATDPIYLLLYAPLHEESGWSSYVTDEAQSRRFLMASALLDNGYASSTRLYGAWCDECGVNGSGVATKSLATTGWLGCPVTVATDTTNSHSLRWYIDNDRWEDIGDYAWTREFENGLVIINPTTRTKSVTIGAGWKKISGSASYGDPAHNDGSSVGTTLSMDPLEAYVLVRDTAGTATPGPTEGALPSRTATPTAQPTGTPGPTPTLGPQATSTPITVTVNLWDFETDNETPPAAATPTPDVEINDGDWPWRSDYADSYTLAHSADSYSGSYSYSYNGSSAGAGENVVANIWSAALQSTPVYKGQVQAALKLDPGSETLGRPHIPLGAWYWTTFNFDRGEQAENGPWQILQCPSSAGSWFYPTSACASAADACKVKFYCPACEPTPTWTELYSDCTGSTWANIDVEWSLETGQPSTMTVKLNETPVVTWTGTPAPTPGTNKWNGILAGIKDVFSDDTNYTVKVDAVNVCGTSYPCEATPIVIDPPPDSGLRWITEVLGESAVIGDCDWNLRGYCGEDDNFIEIASASGDDVTGWKIVAGNCEHEYESDMYGPLRVTFADEMEDTTTGLRCWDGIPSNGTAYLYDENDNLIDSRDYYTYRPGDSWQAAAYTNPAGVWISAAPNPGFDPATPTPTPTTTPTATGTPTLTPTP